MSRRHFLIPTILLSSVLNLFDAPFFRSFGRPSGYLGVPYDVPQAPPTSTFLLRGSSKGRLPCLASGSFLGKVQVKGPHPRNFLCSKGAVVAALRRRACGFARSAASGFPFFRFSGNFSRVPFFSPPLLVFNGNSGPVHAHLLFFSLVVILAAVPTFFTCPTLPWLL